MSWLLLCAAQAVAYKANLGIAQGRNDCIVAVPEATVPIDVETKVNLPTEEDVDRLNAFRTLVFAFRSPQEPIGAAQTLPFIEAIQISMLTFNR